MTSRGRWAPTYMRATPTATASPPTLGEDADAAAVIRAVATAAWPEREPPPLAPWPLRCGRVRRRHDGVQNSADEQHEAEPTDVVEGVVGADVHACQGVEHDETPRSDLPPAGQHGCEQCRHRGSDHRVAGDEAQPVDRHAA